MIIIISSIVLFVMWVVFANTRDWTGDGHHPIKQAAAHLYGVVFFIFDASFNLTVGNVLFLFGGFKSWTLTGRLRYILKGSNELGWRWKLAYFVCRRLISPWQFNHCGIGLGK